MKIEAAFSASPRNTNPHNSGIKRLLSYCFISQSEEYNCYSLYGQYGMISFKLQVEAEVEVLIACAMVHILFGIYIISKNDTF